MELNNKKANELKKDFPIIKNNNLVYLDNSATTQKPMKVVESIKEFYEKFNANIHRGAYKLSVQATEKYDDSRKTVADFINCNSSEVIFTSGTTSSLNSLAYAISSIIPKGKNEIILTEMEHHSNLVPWQQLAKRENMKLKFIRIKEDFTLDIEDLKEKINDKTAILSLMHISNVLGTINPVENIIKIAKEVNPNIITIIDAAQSSGHMKLDIKKIGCDFLAFSGHKMLGPLGIGVLYGRKELLEKISPFNFGGDMIKSVSLEDSDWNKIPERFEAGTQNVADAYGLKNAIEYLNEIGIDNISKWEKELFDYSLKKLREIKGIEIYNSMNNSAGIISFNLKGIHNHDVASLLDDKNIAVRAGHHCAMPLMKKLKVQGGGTLRISLCFYNTFEDIDKLVESLKKISERFEE
ncbi:cysteine desulfurase CsdA [Candidatus Pacearchaeota archaeon CG10_big_fil_rev_8_21_14_0_10_34_12]|nr:MAG: cysteine desulfurase CsdA [Candidatus Pacearchaeota archaeon CG10_big_fil_rev_8_21_14_0_10_34_12]